MANDIIGKVGKAMKKVATETIDTVKDTSKSVSQKAKNVQKDIKLKKTRKEAETTIHTAEVFIRNRRQNEEVYDNTKDIKELIVGIKNVVSNLAPTEIIAICNISISKIEELKPFKVDKIEEDTKKYIEDNVKQVRIRALKMFEEIKELMEKEAQATK